MKTALPAAFAALSLLLAPIAQAEPGNGRGGGNGNGARGGEGFCPPGLARRDPACVPPGQAGRERAEDAVTVFPELFEQLAEEDDEDARAALAIVGGLFALAAIQRADRAAQTEQSEAEEASPNPASAPVEAFVLPEVPARPASIETLALQSEPEPEPQPVAVPPAGPPVPVAPQESALVIPPPPPLAEDVETAPATDLSDVFERAAEEGDTGF